MDRKTKRTTIRTKLVVFAAAPFALVAIGARMALPRAAEALARKMSAVASIVGVLARAPAPAPTPAPARAPAPAPALDVDRDARTRAAHPVKPRQRSVAPPATSGTLLISAERVVQLMPRLRSVVATNAVDAQGRPTGAGLAGVGALGVGLADGDVVTSIEGRPTLTTDDAMAAGVAAYGSGARAIHATVARGNDTLQVIVGIPTVDGGA